jgi:hypothetical protein
MSQFRRSVAVVATIAAVVAVPASASAKTSSTASKTSVAAVQTQVANAATATKRLKRYVRLGDTTRAAKQLKIARKNSAGASRTARRLANAAGTEQAASAAAGALTIAGSQYDMLLETLTALVDDGPAQASIAGGIQPTIAGKAQIIEFLTNMLDKVPASVRPVLAEIIASLGAGDATEVVNLDNALDTGGLPGTISGIVSQCLAMATQAIESAMQMVQGFLPMLPTDVQGPLGNILTQVTGIVGSIVPAVLDMVTGLIDQVLGSVPIIGGGTSTGGGSSTGIGGLFGGLLGGGSGGGIVGGILSPVMNLVNSVFGGLLGH